MKLAFAFAAVALLSACASLSAEAPLFTPADQIGPGPPIQAGVWVLIEDDCTERAALRRGRLPRDCKPFELRRTEDGAWLATFVGLPPEDVDADDIRPIRMIIAPAIEGATAEAYSPLYVAEMRPIDPEASSENIGYAALAPVGVLPATEMYLIASISCAEIVRQGPIEGVDLVHNERGEITSCWARSQAAVRIATQRAIIEQIGGLQNQRFIRVRD